MIVSIPHEKKKKNCSIPRSALTIICPFFFLRFFFFYRWKKMWDLHPPLRLRRSRDGHTRLHLACFFLAQEAHVFTEQGEDSPPLLHLHYVSNLIALHSLRLLEPQLKTRS